MTTVGRSGIGRMILGSVADRIMREADVPVFVVNPHVPRAPPQTWIA